MTTGTGSEFGRFHEIRAEAYRRGEADAETIRTRTDRSERCGRSAGPNRDPTMRTYREWSPTQYDRAGLNADDLERGAWLVLPTIRTRDSGTLERCNFDAALEQLGGESDTVEIHRFGHWACGWLEIVLVDPSRIADAQAIEDRLEDYPVLDEDALGTLEFDEAADAWEAMRPSDRIDWLRRDRHDCGSLAELLAAIRGGELPQGVDIARLAGGC